MKSPRAARYSAMMLPPWLHSGRSSRPPPSRPDSLCSCTLLLHVLSSLPWKGSTCGETEGKRVALLVLMLLLLLVLLLFAVVVFVILVVVIVVVVVAIVVFVAVLSSLPWRRSACSVEVGGMGLRTLLPVVLRHE
eukprot:273099-Chlamydomonas_euryale.AAC.1